MRLLVLLLAACDGEPRLESPISVPASWKEHRLGIGHVGHLEKGTKCRDCHGVIEGSTFERPSIVACERCHEGTIDRTHTSTGAPSNDCYACHPFKEKTDVSSKGCERCHTEARRHSEPECTECHAPHADPPIQIRSCAKCHEDRPSAIHRATGEVAGCVACHSGHGPAKEPRVCDRCHEAKRPARRKGHDDCATCHVPHGSKVVKDCGSCHRTETRGLHEQCSSCHLVHEEPKAVAVCESCHDDLLVEHDGGATDSADRRVLVERSVERMPLPRAELGTPEPSTTRLNCSDCHLPHRPRKACVTCHEIGASDGSLHAGGLACSACHRSHALAVGAAAGCEACHAREHGLAGANEGHAECSACHVEAHHSPKKAVTPCKACHAIVERPQHDRCALCHEVHSGRPKIEATCESCHPRKPNLHTKAGECSACHGAHEKDASCGSCHAAPPGLHRNTGHADCGTCHRAHDEQIERGRRTCDGCHALASHEPEVSTCVGCHPFR